MPFITPDRVKEIRKEIKKSFPKFKFSIRTENYSSVNVNIMSGPVEMIVDREDDRRYEQVNHFFITDHYENHPEVRDILQKIYEIMNRGNYIESEDGDYGSIPSFYCNLSIGKWDKPYIIT